MTAACRSSFATPVCRVLLSPPDPAPVPFDAVLTVWTNPVGDDIRVEVYFTEAMDNTNPPVLGDWSFVQASLGINPDAIAWVNNQHLHFDLVTAGVEPGDGTLTYTNNTDNLKIAAEIPCLTTVLENVPQDP